MKNIVIVGAGGLASDLYTYLQLKLNKTLQIKGILVDDIKDYYDLNVDERYLGKIIDYKLKEDDLLLIAIGENPGRKKILEYFNRKKANFFTLIHETTIVHPSANIGEGCIIGPFSIIGSNVSIHSNTFINKYCNIGHNSTIQKNLIMYPYSMIGGNCNIGKNVILSTRATIAPKCKIGDNSIISAHTFIKKDIEDNILVFNFNKNIKKKINNSQ